MLLKCIDGKFTIDLILQKGNKTRVDTTFYFCNLGAVGGYYQRFFLEDSTNMPSIRKAVNILNCFQQQFTRFQLYWCVFTVQPQEICADFDSKAQNVPYFEANVKTNNT